MLKVRKDEKTVMFVESLVWKKLSPPLIPLGGSPNPRLDSPLSGVYSSHTL